MLKTLRTLMSAAFSAAVVVSCASGAPDGEAVEKVELAQRLDCALFNSDGDKCTLSSGATGICAGGVCCLCVDQKSWKCLNCDDRNSCTKDACEGYTKCINEPLRDYERCSNGVCIGDSCCAGCVDKQGVCRSNGAGSPAFCGVGGATCDVCADDGNPCTDDICTPQGTCEHPPKQNGVSCESDKDVCNGTSSCQDGKCRDGTPLNCESGNPCKTTHCDPELGCVSEDNDDPCQDGNPCTVNDRCSGGTCRGGEPADCNDNEFCTDDGCDPKQGCVHTPKAPDTACDDRNACTTVSACSRDGRCLAGPGELNCDDGDPCTINGCNVAAQACDYTMLEDAGTPCVPPSNKCLVNATCDALGACTGGVPKDCNDDNPCTADECDPETGQCAPRELDGDACSDDSPCTVNDRCEQGRCVGDTIECTASDDCHEPGSCDEATGLCTDLRKANGAECGSGTGTCASGSCVPNPTAGAGGVEGEGEGGAPGSGGADTGDAGDAALGGTSGGGGVSGTPSTAARGGTDDEQRGPPFARKRGGCSASTGSAYADPFALGLFASVIALAARGRSRRKRDGAGAAR